MFAPKLPGESMNEYQYRTAETVHHAGRRGCTLDEWDELALTLELRDKAAEREAVEQMSERM